MCAAAFFDRHTDSTNLNYGAVAVLRREMQRSVIPLRCSVWRGLELKQKANRISMSSCRCQVQGSVRLVVRRGYAEPGLKQQPAHPRYKKAIR